MEELNHMESRKLTPQQSMARLEKAVNVADQRIRMRREVASRASLGLGLLFAFPMSCYMCYHLFAPYGVMQNYKSSSGAYLYWAQNFMYRQRSTTAVYRPEFYLKETGSSLHLYTKRIEQKKASGEVQQGVHHPTAWH